MVTGRRVLFIFCLLVAGCYESNITIEDIDNIPSDLLVIIGILNAGESPEIYVRPLEPFFGGKVSYNDDVVKTGKGFLISSEQVIDTFVFDGIDAFQLSGGTKVVAGQSYTVQFSAEGFKTATSDPVTVPGSPPKINVRFFSDDCISGINDFRFCRLSISTDSLRYDMRMHFTPSPGLDRKAWPMIAGDAKPLCDELDFTNTKFIPSSCLQYGEVSYFAPFELDSLRYEDFRYSEYSLRFDYISTSYFKAMSNQREQEDYEFALLFEPSLEYTNINNGLGFVGASNDTTVVVQVN